MGWVGGVLWCMAQSSSAQHVKCPSEYFNCSSNRILRVFSHFHLYAPNAMNVDACKCDLIWTERADGISRLLNMCVCVLLVPHILFSCACCTTLKWFNRVSVVPGCKWFSVLERTPRTEKKRKICACFKVFIAESCRCSVWWTEPYLKQREKNAGNTKNRNNNRTYTIRFFSSFFISKQNNSIEILSSKHHLLFICIHGIEWRLLLLFVVLAPHTTATCIRTHIAGVSLMATN